MEKTNSKGDDSALKELETIALKHRNENPSNRNGNASVDQLLERDLSLICDNNKKDVRKMMILDILEGNGEMSFNDICAKTKIDNNILAYFIALLKKYNWLDMRKAQDQNYFKITEKAKDYLGIIHEYA